MLIHNATIWTGIVVDGQEEIISGDVLMDKGIVKWVGGADDLMREAKKIYGSNLAIVDVGGAWATPGYVHVLQFFLNLYYLYCDFQSC